MNGREVMDGKKCLPFIPILRMVNSVGGQRQQSTDDRGRKR